MKQHVWAGIAGVVLSTLAGAALAGETAKPRAKDVVLATMMPPQPFGAQQVPANGMAPMQGQMPQQAQAPRYDGMVVSVLEERADGVLLPRSTQMPFQTGQRFRIKVLAPRDGELQVYNTNPLGVTTPTPVWKGQVRAGLETISEPFMLTGNRGEDQLHVVLAPQNPAQQQNPAWFQSMFSGKTTKDIRLVTENTQQATYVYNQAGQGSSVTIRIRHQ